MGPLSVSLTSILRGGTFVGVDRGAQGDAVVVRAAGYRREWKLLGRERDVMVVLSPGGTLDGYKRLLP